MGKNRLVMLVDGFNLYYGLRAKYDRKYLWLDLEQVAIRLCKDWQSLEAVYYFTTRVRNAPDSERRQDAYLQALGTRPSITIVEGRFQEKTFTCRQCGSGWKSYEEKESDVNLAVKLVEITARDEYDTALLVSGDSDLCPAVRTAEALDPNKRIIAVFPPDRTSNELRDVCTADFVLGHGVIRGSQLPDPVAGPAGDIGRPPRWS